MPPSKKTFATATELLGNSQQSVHRQLGRRLILKFTGTEKPQLVRIEFRAKESAKSSYWQTGISGHHFSWGEGFQAVSLLFLEYARWSFQVCEEPFCFSGAAKGSPAATLGDAFYQDKNSIKDLLIDYSDPQAPVNCLRLILGGTNLGGNNRSRPRCISINSDLLPPDCVEVFWDAIGPVGLTKVEQVRTLAERILKNFGKTEDFIPPTNFAEASTGAKSSDQLPIPQSDVPSTPVKPSLASSTAAALPPIVAGNPPPTHTLSLPESFLKSLEAIAKAATRPDPTPVFTPAETPLPQIVPQPEPTPEISQEPEIPWRSANIPLITPELLTIHNPDRLLWEDSMGLLDFGEDESGNDIWKIKDACEGVLILGAPGSGKTSSSGFAIAQSFLTSGFGGLVLVAKTDEAQRWQNLCARFGRAEDCIVVTRDGPHKFNILAYETQRPGERLAVTDDLISFFRILIAVVSKRTGQNAKEDFWLNATNQLMRALFDAFLLAGEPLTVDALTHFITQAPEKPTQNWETIPFFGDVLARAKKGATSPEDNRIYRNCMDYWTENYPSIAPVTRSGITLGFTAMADALGGRGIFNLISSETTLTPEMILSGKIVILDLPLKDCGQGGLLVQAAWKYLFQRAIERRADKGRKTARPVFLWEDEGHLFFSQHDIDFQPTARDCRAAHVIISQSLHNFYQLGHNPHAVQGVFATMNTQIFHANGDLETNKWASEKMGTELTTHVNVSVTPQPRRGFWDSLKPHESTASTSINQCREKVFQPESFALLKKGGDGSCQAVILWVSHPFASNNNRPFRITVFEQDNGL